MTSDRRGVFSSDQLDQLVSFYEVNGYATLRRAFDEPALAEAEDELAAVQRLLSEGELDARHGTVILDEPDATIDNRPFAHYVCFATAASPTADRLVHHPVLVEIAGRLLGPNAWLLDYEQFGVVYQDARPDPGSGYSRIGWHTDHQSGPHLDIWPGAAFTIHFDPTSPANGFLRTLPGSHLGGPQDSRSASSGFRARSPCTRIGGTSSSTTPTSGTARPGARPKEPRPSADICGAAGTAAPGWSRVTGPTTS